MILSSPIDVYRRVVPVGTILAAIPEVYFRFYLKTVDFGGKLVNFEMCDDVCLSNLYKQKKRENVTGELAKSSHR